MLLDILLFHKFKLWVLYQLSKTDHESPRMRSLRLESLQEYLRNLLKDYFSAGLSLDGEDDAREVEGVPTWESKFVDYGVQEAETSLVVKSLYNLFEGEGVSLGASAFTLSPTGTLLVSEVKDYCTDHIGVDSPPSIDNLLTLFHLPAYINYKLWIPCP